MRGLIGSRRAPASSFFSIPDISSYQVATALFQLSWDGRAETAETALLFRPSARRRRRRRRQKRAAGGIFFGE
eukprot:4220125-Prymnesium_polylepis.1